VEMCGTGYFNMETQACIRIETDGHGDFQSGLVIGSVDGHVEDVGTESRFTVTWEGRGGMDPMSGGGCLRPTKDD